MYNETYWMKMSTLHWFRRQFHTVQR